MQDTPDAMSVRGRLIAAFLRSLRDEPFSKIKITELCRRAHIARASFYTHFSSLDELADAAIDDAFSVVCDVSAEDYEHMLRRLGPIVESGDMKAFAALPLEALPPVHRMAATPAHRALLADDKLFMRIEKRMTEWESKRFLVLLMKRAALPREEAEAMVHFVVTAVLSLNRRIGWDNSDKWAAAQLCAMRFVKAGVAALVLRRAQPPQDCQGD
jgi:AcrR family transcriptional regulator